MPKSQLTRESCSHTANGDSRQIQEVHQCATTFWVQLIHDRRWSLRQKHQLIERLGCPCAIYQCATSELREFTNGRVSRVSSAPKAAELGADAAWLEQPANELITLSDPLYPQRLKEIADPPIGLFAIGDTGLLTSPSIAIVGSRRPTPVGAKMTGQIAGDLAQIGVTVVSGMALGVDGLAHQAALECSGSTIAVMGCGLDTVYPARNKHLFKQIAKRGLLLSEFPIGVPPDKHTFPRRNRIVSGLSLGVVIVEAAERSGTLITARLAVEQNRELMVVPGSSISSQYRGSHRLIKEGATLIDGVDDILFSLREPLADSSCLNSAQCVDSDKRSTESTTDLFSTTNEQGVQLLQYISLEPTSIDHIISMSGLTAAEVSSMLLTLEIAGSVAITPDGRYVNLT